MNHPAPLAETRLVDQLLADWQRGERGAYDQIMALLYDDLRLIAHRQFRRERIGHTLQTGDLVNKLYLKLLESRNIPWTNRAHFLASAGRVMRQILVDHARAYLHRGGEGRIALEAGSQELESEEGDPARLVALDQALDKMEELDPDMARIANVRLVLGLTLEESAAVLELPINRVKREWLMIRKFLAHVLWDRGGPEG